MCRSSELKDKLLSSTLRTLDGGVGFSSEAAGERRGKWRFGLPGSVGKRRDVHSLGSQAGPGPSGSLVSPGEANVVRQLLLPTSPSSRAPALSQDAYKKLNKPERLISVHRRLPI